MSDEVRLPSERFRTFVTVEILPAFFSRRVPTPMNPLHMSGEVRPSGENSGAKGTLEIFGGVRAHVFLQAAQAPIRFSARVAGKPEVWRDLVAEQDVLIEATLQHEGRPADCAGVLFFTDVDHDVVDSEVSRGSEEFSAFRAELGSLKKEKKIDL